MNDELRNEIDRMPLEDLLRRWRFAPAGDRLFQGASGEYAAERLGVLRAAVGPAQWTAVSKRVGWG